MKEIRVVTQVRRFTVQMECRTVQMAFRILGIKNVGLLQNIKCRQENVLDNLILKLQFV